MVDVPRKPTADEPSQERPSGEVPARDERLAVLLARYDEAAAAGMDTPGGVGETALPIEDEVLLADARDCLQLLQEAWWPESPTVERVDNNVGVPQLGGTELLRFGRKVGRFEILRELGRGGFGIVFLAYDPRLKREVALKVPRPEAVWSPERRARFVREGQAAASLNHPNIVTVFDAEDDGPICCIAAEFIAGPTLSAWLREQTEPVPARTAAQWLFELATAVHHAHERGILHRDLKPSNVLMAPAARGTDVANVNLWTPKLTDFGLALWLENRTEETQGSALLGTPRYMAPEQLRSERRLVGAATDVYGLGAVLYEILNGQAPFWGETDLDILRRAAEDEPWRPIRLRPGLPRDLRTICEKCLEREPHRRYATAADLADDLQRFLSGKPIAARPTRIWERAFKWAKRRPAVAALSTISAVVSLCLFVGAVHYSITTREYNQALEVAIERQGVATEEITRQRNAAIKQSYVNLLHHLGSLFTSRQSRLLEEEMLGAEHSGEANELAGFEWRYLQRLAHCERAMLQIQRAPVSMLAISPDGSVGAASATTGRISFFEPRTLFEHYWMQKHSSTIQGLTFSPDSRLFATAVNKTFRHADGDERAGESWLSFCRDYNPMAKLPTNTRDARCIAFSPDGQWMATAGARQKKGVLIGIWDVGTQELVAELALTGIFRVENIAFTPDSRGLFMGFRRRDRRPEGGVVSWAWRDTPSHTELVGVKEAVSDLVVVPDGKLLIVATHSNRLHFLNQSDGQEAASPRAFPPGDARIRLTADGKSLVVACWLESKVGDRSAILMFDAASGQPTGTFWPVESAVNDVATMPDCDLILMGCDDGFVRARELGSALEHHTRSGHEGEAWSISFSPDGSRLVSSGDDHRLVLWDYANGNQIDEVNGHHSLVTQVLYSPDAKWVASASFDGSVRLWNADQQQRSQVLAHGEGRVRSVAFSPDSKHLAAAGDNGLVKIWNIRDGRLVHSLNGHTNKVRGVAYSTDGNTLYSVGNDGKLNYWDTRSGHLQEYSRVDEPSGTLCLALSHDGRILATGTWSGAINLYDASSGELLNVLLGHSEPVLCVAFSADDRTVASGSVDCSLRLWNVSLGREVLAFKGLPAQVNDVEFSPSGNELVGALHDGSLRFWHTTADFFQTPTLGP